MKPRDILTSQYVSDYTGPVLLIDPSVVAEKIEQFNVALPRVQINYAVKSNPHQSILQAVHNCGGSFDVASLQEVNLVRSIPNVDISRVVYSNPVRPARYLKQCSDFGIKWFVVDSLNELIKVAANVSNPQVYIRLAIPNDKAQFPLDGKFGITAKEAEQLINHCASHKISLRGISFHPGSQCTDPQGWITGIKIAKNVFHYMQYKGLKPDFLDIGGGFPAKYTREIPSIEVLGQAITNELQDLPNYFRIIAEPGRYICGETAHLLAQVISVTQRDSKVWVYLDTGVYHGIFEMAGNDFEYQIASLSTKSRFPCAIAGPSCDSTDVVTTNAALPYNLVDGDFVVFKHAGAYTTTYATEFNGFPAPRVVVA